MSRTLFAVCKRGWEGKRKLLHVQHTGQLVEDLGVVIVAVELLGIDAVGQHGHGQAGVAVGGEGDAGLVVDDVGDGDAQGLVGAVEHILLLLILAGGGAVDALLIGGPQLLHLVLGEHQLVVGGALGLQAEELLDVGEHILEGGLVLLVGGHIVAVKLGVGDLLVLQQVQVGVVVGAGEADGQAAGLVVAGDQDQGLVGVLGGEVDGHLHRVGQSLGVVDGGAGVVGVAGPVDLAALAHHEEAVLVVAQDLDALGHVVGQGPHVLGAVDLIGHGVAVGQVLVDEDGLLGVGAHLLGVSLGAGHGVAGLGGQRVQVLLVALAAGGGEEAAAGEVLEVGGDHLQADLIVAGAAGLVGVEGGGGGVVEVHGGDDAHGVALLLVELLGDGLVLHRAGLVHVDGPGVGLVAGGDGGGGGGGVRGEGVGVVGDGGAGGLKVHEVEVAGAVQDGALVVVQAGLGLPVVLVGQGAQVVGGGLDLGIAHAVADEQKHILWGFDGLVGQVLCLHRRGGAGFGGRDGRGAAGGQSGAEGRCGQGDRQGTLPIHI
mgnify:CR=1 FL=1